MKPAAPGQTRLDDIVPPKAPVAVIDYHVPADALGAHDAHLTAVLGKTGALAARQPQATIVTVSALAQDFHYLDQAIREGIPARRQHPIRIENLTVGAGQPYSVRVNIAP